VFSTLKRLFKHQNLTGFNPVNSCIQQGVTEFWHEFDIKERYDSKFKKKLSYFLNLLLLVTVSATSFFTLVRCYLMSFTFFTAWHKCDFLKLVYK
jgi:hypothetical protein